MGDGKEVHGCLGERGKEGVGWCKKEMGGGVDKESMGVEEGGRVVHLGQVRS